MSELTVTTTKAYHSDNHANPCTSSNHEWLKILTSAFVGLLSGVALEPMKTRVQRWYLSRTVCKLIKQNLKTIMLIHLANQARGHALKDYCEELKIPTYEHYQSSKPDLFFEDSEASRIGMHCRGGGARCPRWVQRIRDDGRICQRVDT